MTNRPTIDIATFGRYGIQTVPLPRSETAADTLKILGNQLSLKPSSLQHFALYSGQLGSPRLRILPHNSIKGHDLICLQRYGFDCNKELKLLATDEVAVHILFSEALYHFNSDHSKLKPTPDQIEKLEEFLDPNFPTERQFLETIINVKGYSSIQVTAVLRSALKSNTSDLPANSQVIITCSEDHLEIKAAETLTAQWNWKLVRRWKLELPDTARFEVTNVQENAHILEWFSVETKQAALLLQSASDVCTHILYIHQPDKKPVQLVNHGRHIDPLSEFVNTALFGTGPKFTTIGMDQ